MEPEKDFHGWPWTWSDLAVVGVMLAAVVLVALGVIPA